MSLAENLLNTLNDNNVDDDTTSAVVEEPIVVDENRNIIVPNKLKTIAVVGDKNVETVTFKCIRFWDGEHDLSNFAIYINYILPNNQIGTFIPQIKDRYEDYFTFDWVIGTEITKYNGKISFLILARKVDEDDVLQYQWSSLINGDFTVAQGIDVGEIIEDEEKEDLLTSLLQNADLLISLPEKIGDIDTALDSIIAIQNSLMVITFTYAGTKYNALHGMTWKEWIDSEEGHDAGIFHYDDENIYTEDGNRVINEDNEYQYVNTVIVDGGRYNED